MITRKRSQIAAWNARECFSQRDWTDINTPVLCCSVCIASQKPSVVPSSGRSMNGKFSLGRVRAASAVIESNASQLRVLISWFCSEQFIFYLDKCSGIPEIFLFSSSVLTDGNGMGLDVFPKTWFLLQKKLKPQMCVSDRCCRALLVVFKRLNVNYHIQSNARSSW